ncbi:DAK2 domain-containing protein [Pasteuria penetrans]|uniref:DAK2 domain-containing protein n=1 Tax=Pasteuria penetrans TaxID=86005 RepID=UPI000FB29A2C|nr:DAK2 domain-containing protein [Pasteuria penetrans]
MPTVDQKLLLRMLRGGEQCLRENVDQVNSLNVFPVPDGDTGTNMHLTLRAGLQALGANCSATVGGVSSSFARGLLMGARGNSGVILSQLFRGFADAVSGKFTVTVRQFSSALQRGVGTAYQAVLKPVEGTMLTVARESVRAAMQVSHTAEDVKVVLRALVQASEQSVAKTISLLQVLREAGVVDAGGYGLLCVYKGMLSALLDGEDELSKIGLSLPGIGEPAGGSYGICDQKESPSRVGKFSYCVNYLIDLSIRRRSLKRLDERVLRRALEQWGDSIVVVRDRDLLKVHLHTEEVPAVLENSLGYGDLVHVKVENMRLQNHKVRLEGTSPPSSQGGGRTGTLPPQGALSPRVVAPISAAHAVDKPYAIVVVAAGEGLGQLFRSIGAASVVEAGQTCNPSSSEIAEAIDATRASCVFVLPNNGNVVLPAQQAAELAKTPHVVVLPVRTVPQGLAAALAFSPDEDQDTNRQYMMAAAARVRSGEVVRAARATHVNGRRVQPGDMLGICESKIVRVGSQSVEVAMELLSYMLAMGGSVVTILTGADADQKGTEILRHHMKEKHPDVELEIHEGGQPLYEYTLAVE